MAKDKASGVANRHLYSRVSFLYQAATLLAQTTAPGPDSPKSHEKDAHKTAKAKTTEPALDMSRRLLTDIRAISLKTMMRLSPGMKQTICKFCDSLLIEGKTCSSSVENLSKGGRKPWADVLVIRCNACGGEKRFPVDAPRQMRRPNRGEVAAKETVGEEKKG